MKKRTAQIARKTKETAISIALNLDGKSSYRIQTGVGFFDHMLELFAKHSALDLRLEAAGDTHVDYHHVVEDVGICLGEAFAQALGSKAGIVRYGFARVPMDEASAEVCIDLSGRPYLVYDVAVRKQKIGDFPIQLIKEFFRAFTMHARINLHIRLLYGEDVHHMFEAIFKAWARAIRAAVEKDQRLSTRIPSTKGAL